MYLYFRCNVLYELFYYIYNVLLLSLSCKVESRRGVKHRRPRPHSLFISILSCTYLVLVVHVLDVQKKKKKRSCYITCVSSVLSIHYYIYHRFYFLSAGTSYSHNNASASLSLSLSPSSFQL